MPVATPTISPSNLIRQLSDGNDQGTTLGFAPVGAQGGAQPDKIGFFGSVSLQASGNAQAAITRGQAAGTIISFTSTQSGTSVQANTTSEFSMTLMGGTVETPVNTGDLVYVNKPTAQAGLGVGNVRASGVGTIGVTFSNLTGTTITPTGQQTWSAVAVRGFNTIAATLSPAAVQPLSTAEQVFTVTGIRVGDLVQINKPSSQAGLDIVGTRVAGNNSVGITFANVTSATITPTASEAYQVFSANGIDAVNNQIQFQIGASPTSITPGTTTEFLLPVTGLLLGDTVTGISKPTAQLGLGIVGMRVSVPSTIGITFINGNALTTITPTAGEVYNIALNRANPVAPLFLYSQALTPASVPANTTAEQTFTVPGLVASSPVWVNKPSFQNGLGIAGVRVSAANTLAINFANVSTSSITPTAAEVYTIGNFQDPQQTGGTFSLSNGNSVAKAAVGVIQQNAIQTQNLRNAWVAYGLGTGA